MSAEKHTPGPWRVHSQGRWFVAARSYPYDGIARRKEWLAADGTVSEARIEFPTAEAARAAIAKATGSAA